MNASKPPYLLQASAPIMSCLLKQVCLVCKAGGQPTGVSRNLWDRLRGARAAYRGLGADEPDIETAAAGPGPGSLQHASAEQHSTQGTLPPLDMSCLRVSCSSFHNLTSPTIVSFPQLAHVRDVAWDCFTWHSFRLEESRMAARSQLAEASDCTPCAFNARQES